jgi:hypothetical protein
MPERAESSTITAPEMGRSYIPPYKHKLVVPQPFAQSQRTITPPPPAVTHPPPEIKRDVVIVNRTEDIRKRAREMAETQLRQQMREGNWFTQVRLRMAEEYYRQVYTERAFRAIKDHGNPYLSMNVVKNGAVNANHQIAAGLSSGLAKAEQIKTQAKTGIDLEGTVIKEAQGDLKKALIDNILRPIATGTDSPLTHSQIKTQADLQKAIKALMNQNPGPNDLQAVFGRNATHYNVEADFFASDLWETGQQIQEDLKIKAYDENQLEEVVKIYLANSDWAADTRAHFNTADRFVAWAQSRKLTGALINPAIIGAAFSLGTFAIMRAAGASSRAIQYTVPGVGLAAAALFAGLRRDHDIKIDRASHEVDRTYGASIPEKSSRRKALEDYAYDASPVSHLLSGQGQDHLSNQERKNLQDLLQQDLNDFNTRRDLICQVTEIKTRLDFSVRRGVDLITYSSREEVEQGRMQLVKALAQANLSLNSLIDSQTSTQNRNRLKNEIADMKKHYDAEWNKFFASNVRNRDLEFASYRLSQAVGSAIFAAVAGLGTGLLVQEGLALVGRAVPDIYRTPIIGGLFGRGQTVIEKWLNYNPNVSETSSDHNIGNFLNLYNNPNGGTIVVDDLQILAHPDHSVEFINNNNGQVIIPSRHGVLDANGHLFVTDHLPSSVSRPLLDADFRINMNPDTTIQVNETLLSPNGTYTTDISGHHTTVPNGSEWIADPNNPGNWDLVISGHQDKILLDNVHFQDNGQITFDSSHSILNSGNINQPSQTVGGGSHTETKSILGPDGELGRHFTNIDQRQWYSYNQPCSQGNELKFYTFKEGHSVILDMSQMELGYQNGLDPNPIDVQQVIRNHEDGFAFSLPDHRTVWVPEGADGNWDGKLNLNPDDYDSGHLVHTSDGSQLTLGEFSRIILNQPVVNSLPNGNIATELFHHENVFNLAFHDNLGTGKSTLINECGAPQVLRDRVGFIEAGRLVNRGDQNILQDFATITGSGRLPENISVTVENPSSTIFSLEINLNNAITETVSKTVPVFEIIPPEAVSGFVGNEPPPIIPIPFSPRHPLDPLGPPLGGPFMPAPAGPPFFYFQYAFPWGEKRPSELAEIISVTKPLPRYKASFAKLFPPRYTLPKGMMLPIVGIAGITNLEGEPGSVESGPTGATPPGQTIVPSVTVPTKPTADEGEEAVPSSNVPEQPVHPLENPLEALPLIRDTFLKSPHIYLAFSNAVGDIAITSAYLEGIRKYSQNLGQNKKITVVAGKQNLPLLQSLADRYGYELITADPYHPALKARSLLINSPEDNGIVFEFDHFTGMPVVDIYPQGKLLVRDLFAASVALYDNLPPDQRFTSFFNDLLSIPDNERVEVTPRVEVPPGSEQIYQKLSKKYRIDPEKRQVGIVVEASHPMKRYSLLQWRETMLLIQDLLPNTEFNIFYNPDKELRSYPEKTLRDVFRAVPDTRLVKEELGPTMTLLAQQDLVLSNDTGLAHVATIVENGPQVVSLHIPLFPPSTWVTDERRHIGLLPKKEDLTNEFNPDETDENQKCINKIRPEEIARIALESLRRSHHFQIERLHLPLPGGGSLFNFYGS